MLPWTFYTVFIGTIGSIIGHGSIALTHHERRSPKTFSELAAAEEHLLLRFRWIALSCSTLLGITVYWYIAPRNNLGAWQSVAWSLEYFGGIAMLALPAKGQFLYVHNACANAMAVGMLSLAYLFVPALEGGYKAASLTCAISITILGLLALGDKQRFIVYELSLIFISHLTICIAALGLRYV